MAFVVSGLTAQERILRIALAALDNFEVTTAWVRETFRVSRATAKRDVAAVRAALEAPVPHYPRRAKPKPAGTPGPNPARITPPADPAARRLAGWGTWGG